MTHSASLRGGGGVGSGGKSQCLGSTTWGHYLVVGKVTGTSISQYLHHVQDWIIIIRHSPLSLSSVCHFPSSYTTVVKVLSSPQQFIKDSTKFNTIIIIDIDPSLPTIIQQSSRCQVIPSSSSFINNSTKLTTIITIFRLFPSTASAFTVLNAVKTSSVHCLNVLSGLSGKWHPDISTWRALASASS